MTDASSAVHEVLPGTTRHTLAYGHGDESAANRINTLDAFARARAAGADGIELDLRRTADDQLVVIHDPQLRDGRRIDEVPRAEPSDEIPALAIVLDLCLGMRVNLEIMNYPLDPLLPTAVLYLSQCDPAQLLDAVVQHGHRCVHPCDTTVDGNFMRLARARGLEVNAWVEAAEENRLRELVALGVDGLITSEIELTQRVVRVAGGLNTQQAPTEL